MTDDIEKFNAIISRTARRKFPQVVVYTLAGLSALCLLATAFEGKLGFHPTLEIYSPFFDAAVVLAIGAFVFDRWRVLWRQR